MMNPMTMKRGESNRDDEGTQLANRFEKLASVSAFRVKAKNDNKRREDLQSQRTLDWTTVKSPGTSVGDALADGIETNQVVHMGIRATKVSTSGKLQSRVLTVSNDRYALFATKHNVVKKGASSSEQDGAHGFMSTISKTVPFTKRGIAMIRGGGTVSARDMYVRYIDVADLDGVQTGLLGTHKLELSRGRSNTNNRLKTGKDSKLDKRSNQIVTICHHGNQTLDIVISKQDEQQALVDCITNMIDVYDKAQHLVGSEELLLRYIWYDVDANNDGLIGVKEFQKILLRINLYLKNPAKIYKTYLQEQRGTRNPPDGVTYHECMCLLQRIKSGYYDKKKTILPSDQIWNDVFGPNTTHVSPHEFLNKFLFAKQDEMDATLDDVESLFFTLNQMELNRENEEIITMKINRTRFEAFLVSDINDAYDPEAQELHTSSTLDQPMARYWINTSHNTYLLGDQLQSSSSVGMYMTALRRGCKCVELDCWDGEKPKKGSPADLKIALGGANLVPVVYHGHTLTSKIAFADIVYGVKRYLDAHPDTYPIILSLENHCSHPYQEAMAKILRDTLGDYLYIPELKENEMEDLPSPEYLRGKVVIKGKRPPEPEDGPEGDDEFDPYEDIADSASPSTPPSKKDGGVAEVAKPPKIVKELADMTLFHGTKYKSFEQSIEMPPSHMHSISEPKIAKIMSKDPVEQAQKWRTYNVHHMTRTYPGGARVDSSNYNPIQAWAMGCQLVALNFQTSDVPLLLNDGRFRQNGGCGYVLKPPSILGEPVENSGPITLKVRVLSGSCLPKPHGEKEGEHIDPYVEVKVHDVGKKEQYTSESYYTKEINDNGFCPVWNEGEFHEFPVYSKDVAMVQFSLLESDMGLDDKVADAMIPISCLRKGFRCIQLYDQYNTRTGPFGFATLLVEIDYVDSDGTEADEVRKPTKQNSITGAAGTAPNSLKGLASVPVSAVKDTAGAAVATLKKAVPGNLKLKK